MDDDSRTSNDLGVWIGSGPCLLPSRVGVLGRRAERAHAFFLQETKCSSIHPGRQQLTLLTSIMPYDSTFTLEALTERLPRCMRCYAEASLNLLRHVQKLCSARLGCCDAASWPIPRRSAVLTSYGSRLVYPWLGIFDIVQFVRKDSQRSFSRHLTTSPWTRTGLLLSGTVDSCEQ